MPLWNEYFTPKTITEALSLRVRFGHDAQWIAGGTDMVLDMQQGNHAPVAALVDVTTIEHLSDIWQDEEWIVIGAAATHTAIEAHPLVRRHGQALVESCGVVGGPQVRNVATIGGNVAHALPAADGAIGLLALGAEVQVCTLDGEDLTCTWQPLLSIYAGPGRNQLKDNQLLAAFRFPAVQARQGSAFDRIMRPQGVALPILGVAAKVTLDESLTRVTAAAIVVGPAGPLPFRATTAEQVLTSAATVDEQVIEQAMAAAQAQAQLRTSKHRATKAYRHELVAVLLRRVVGRAVERARGGV